jgi:hypothetical protein
MKTNSYRTWANKASKYKSGYYYISISKNFRTNKLMLQFNKKLTALALLSVASVTGNMLIIDNVSAQSQVSGIVKDVTLWSKSNRQGAKFDSDKGVPDLSQVGFDNKASSIAVNNGQKWRFYEGKNFKGGFVEIGPDESRGSLGQFNNRVSSFKSVP